MSEATKQQISTFMARKAEQFPELDEFAELLMRPKVYKVQVKRYGLRKQRRHQKAQA